MAGGKCNPIHPYCETCCCGECLFFLTSHHDSFPDVPRWAALTAPGRTPEWHPKYINLGQLDTHTAWLCNTEFGESHHMFFHINMFIFTSALRFTPLKVLFSAHCLGWHHILHCFDLLLTFQLILAHRRIPWRLWERTSVGWHAVRMTPSMPMLPSLLVRLNKTASVWHVVFVFQNEKNTSFQEMNVVLLSFNCHEAKTLIPILSYLQLLDIGTCLS